ATFPLSLHDALPISKRNSRFLRERLLDSVRGEPVAPWAESKGLALPQASKVTGSRLSPGRRARKAISPARSCPGPGPAGERRKDPQTASRSQRVRPVQAHLPPLSRGPSALFRIFPAGFQPGGGGWECLFTPVPKIHRNTCNYRHAS